MKLHCQINSEATGYLEHAMEEMNFSARAHDRILKVSRTLSGTIARWQGLGRIPGPWETP